MNISVIIPVYNAAGFVGEAVQSALMQAETAEVILVEDGSEDNSLEVCQQIATTDVRIRLLRHEGGVNKGAGPSRNLGIQAAQSEWIAFLDADDYYLPHRFSRAADFLNEHPDYDGVAEAIGVKFEDTIGKERFLLKNGLPLETNEKEIVKGLYEEVNHRDLFESLFLGNMGGFHLNGFVIKKSILVDEKSIRFSNLEMTQDTLFIYLIARNYQIKAFDQNRIVGIYRIYKGNRWTKDNKSHLYFYAKSRLEIFKTIDHSTTSLKVARKLVNLYPRIYNEQYFQTDNKLFKAGLLFIGYCRVIFFYPSLIRRAIWSK